MQNLDDLQQIFLCQKQSHTHTHKPVAIPCHIGKAQHENESQKKGILKHVKHFSLLHIASYNKIRETGEYYLTNSAEVGEVRVIMTSSFLLYIEKKKILLPCISDRQE